MSAKTDIWMPLYIGDYLRDTTRLTTMQHGAYLLLIMDYWTNGAPPDDDAVLASITKTSPEDWAKMRQVLMPKFEISDGAWHHGRIDAEIEEAQENRRKNLERSQKANLAKATKAGSKDASEATYKVTSSPSPSPSNKSSSSKKSTRASFQKPVDVSDVTWLSFLTNCKAKQKPPTDLVMLKIRAEATKAGLSLEDALVFASERSWARFEHEWWQNELNKSGQRQQFSNPADAARTTVPGTKERDPALVKIEQDRERAAPPPAEVKAKMAELLGRMKV